MSTRRQKRIWTAALVLALVLALMPSARPAQAATYTVTNINDSGAGSLRQAIIDANTNAGADTINFNIPCGGGVCTIQPTSALPTLSGGGTTIDGYSQTGAAYATDSSPAVLRIQIDGANAGAADGFCITSANNVIRGLLINRFALSGVYITGSGATGNTVSGNYIGIAATGTADLGNTWQGVSIWIAQNNTVGGDAAGERNVISGNDHYGVRISGSGATGNTVSGNYIGTAATGTADLGNTRGGVYIGGDAQNNTVGGNAAGERNVISGNDGYGVQIYGSGATGNTVSGNYIGTAATGTADLGNAWGGVSIDGAQNNTVGGDTEKGERNVISGNDGYGVQIYGSGATGNTVSGNHIGTDAGGTAYLGNSGGGVLIYGSAQNNTVGGDAASERNVISGNDQRGVSIGDSGTMGNTVSGNYIGTAVSGTADLGNSGGGVVIGGGAQNNTVGGDAAGERNVISGNDWYGVSINASGTNSNTVSGNYIGTDATGTADLGNSGSGVFIWSAQNNTVGGDTEGERNVISGNDLYGVEIYDSGATGNTVSGNYIGTDASGTADLGNTWHGVIIADGAQNNTVGPDNLIAYNDSDGVRVDGSTTTNNTITHNSIYSNTMGINLVSGANGNIAAPVIVTTTVGSVNVVGTACPNCTVEVFENGHTDGEGETYVGSSTATAGGAFTVTVSSLSQPYLTATATDVVSGTSEFSAVFTATVPLAPPAGSLYLPIILKNH